MVDIRRRVLEDIVVALKYREKKTGEENRKLLLQSCLIKAKIAESLNSMSVPQRKFLGRTKY